MSELLTSIESGEILTVEGLKKAFWTLAKKYHPDGNSDCSDSEKFIAIKNEYDAAILVLCKRKKSDTPETGADLEYCRMLFSELVAGNFPLRTETKIKNKAYRRRLEALNFALAAFGREYTDLIPKVENELDMIRGPGPVASHEFGVVRSYFVNLVICFEGNKGFSKTYIKESYDLVRKILCYAQSTLLFLELLMRGISLE